MYRKVFTSLISGSLLVFREGGTEDLKETAGGGGGGGAGGGRKGVLASLFTATKGVLVAAGGICARAKDAIIS